MTEKKARGRPPIPESKKKKYWGSKFEPVIIKQIKSKTNSTAYIEKLVRKDMESDDE